MSFRSASSHVGHAASSTSERADRDDEQDGSAHDGDRHAEQQEEASADVRSTIEPNSERCNDRDTADEAACGRDDAANEGESAELVHILSVFARAMS